jgi:hypothetical protein
MVARRNTHIILMAKILGKHTYFQVGYEVLTAVSTMMAVFWVVALCSLAEVALIALMMEAARTSETLVNFYQTTRHYNPEDSHLHTFPRPQRRWEDNTKMDLRKKGCKVDVTGS